MSLHMAAKGLAFSFYIVACMQMLGATAHAESDSQEKFFSILRSLYTEGSSSPGMVPVRRPNPELGVEINLFGDAARETLYKSISVINTALKQQVLSTDNGEGSAYLFFVVDKDRMQGIRIDEHWSSDLKELVSEDVGRMMGAAIETRQCITQVKVSEGAGQVLASVGVIDRRELGKSGLSCWYYFVLRTLGFTPSGIKRNFPHLIVIEENRISFTPLMLAVLAATQCGEGGDARTVEDLQRTIPDIRNISCP